MNGQQIKAATIQKLGCTRTGMPNIRKFRSNCVGWTFVNTGWLQFVFAVGFLPGAA
jgi:hypothetical protein